MEFLGYANDEIINLQEGLPAWQQGWNIRVAVRAVMFDAQKRVALMHVGAYNIYKLPGGGVDEEENLEGAFGREIKEETGCDCKKGLDIGMFVEKRGQWKLYQVSFAYTADLLKKGELELTQEEKDTGFSLQWADNIDKAIELVSQSKSERYDDKYIRLRDAEILKMAKKIMSL